MRRVRLDDPMSQHNEKEVHLRTDTLLSLVGVIAVLVLVFGFLCHAGYANDCQAIQKNAATPKPRPHQAQTLSFLMWD
jgi:heme/copper-type cytochrome/quinol oxidase subunit 2